MAVNGRIDGIASVRTCVCAVFNYNNWCFVTLTIRDAVNLTPCCHKKQATNKNEMFDF